MDNRPAHLETDYKHELSPRQREVLALVARGKTYGEIADALGITLDGVKWHMREVLTKLGVNSREEAADWWRQEHSLSGRFSRLARALAPLAGVRVALAGAAMTAVAGVAIAGTVLTWWSWPGQSQEAAPVVEGGGPPPCLDGPTQFEFGSAGTNINNGEAVTFGLSGGYSSWDHDPPACSVSDHPSVQLMLDGKLLPVLGNGIAFEFRAAYAPVNLKLPDGSVRRQLQTTATTSTPMFEWTNWCGDHSQAATIHIATETYTARDGKVTTPKCLDASQPSKLVVINRTVHNVPVDTTVVEVDPTAGHAP